MFFRWHNKIKLQTKNKQQLASTFFPPHSELSEDLEPKHSLFIGKPDIYHALQACLIPLFPATRSLTRVNWQIGSRQ